MVERKKSILTQRKISIPASAQETTKVLERKVSGIIHKDSLPISIVVDKIPKETKPKVVRTYFQVSTHARWCVWPKVVQFQK